MIPLKVLNRLRLGRAVAARVPPLHPEHQAWVRLEPLLDPEHGVWENPHSLERRAISLNGADPIWGFEIRYLEIPDQDLEDYWETGRLEIAVDERAEVYSEEELVGFLARRHWEFADFRIPAVVGYHFG